jgi:GMP synthase (glutamine-hydrolysing)
VSVPPRLLVVQHQPDAGLGRLREPLAAVSGLDVRRPYAGEELPADLAGLAGLVVLGGEMGALDDDSAPWLPQTRELLAAAVDQHLPALGICLGAQLLAAATGGGVARGDAGLEVGVGAIRLLPTAEPDPLVGDRPAGTVLRVLHDHADAVTRLPPAAVPLAVGERYRHQVFRLGSAAWGVQYHPEVSAQGFARWMRDECDAVLRHGRDPHRLLRDAAAVEADLADLARWHADRFAAVVTGSMRLTVKQ